MMMLTIKMKNLQEMMHDTDDPEDDAAVDTTPRPQLWKEHSKSKGASFNIPKVVPRDTQPMTQIN